MCSKIVAKPGSSAQKFVYKISCFLFGHYKTWTVDYGLDCGLDHGLVFEMSYLAIGWFAAWRMLRWRLTLVNSGLNSGLNSGRMT